MFGMLPDLTPRDPHSLWYTPLRGPGQLPNPPDQNHHGAQADAAAGAHHGNGGAPGAHQSRQRAMLVERTALSRLAADEAYLRHRKANVQNFGSGWLKPPGVSKTLHQMREEKRELEEHAEAMRREQLAQELAEAEAGGGDGDGDDGGGGGGMVDGDPESGMDDVQLDGAQDLDDDIPEAGDADFGYGDDDDEDDDDDDEEDEAEDSDEDGEITREERQNDLMAARMRLTDDAFREALVRGEPEGDDMYGGGEELEEEDRGHLLDEEDLGPDGEGGHGGGMGDMDADLDDDIPEAGDEDGGYEHTDSEAELSSSNSSSEEEEEEDEENSENNSEDVNDESRIVAEDDDSEEEDSTRQSLDIGFAPRAGALGPPGSPTGQLRGMMMRQHAPRHSMDLSGLLSNDESSFMDSSPIRRARR